MAEPVASSDMSSASSDEEDDVQEDNNKLRKTKKARQSCLNCFQFCLINNQTEYYLPAYLLGGKSFLIVKLIRGRKKKEKKTSSFNVVRYFYVVAFSKSCYISLGVA